jgi:hypothetical protein
MEFVSHLLKLVGNRVPFFLTTSRMTIQMTRFFEYIGRCFSGSLLCLVILFVRWGNVHSVARFFVSSLAFSLTYIFMISFTHIILYFSFFQFFNIHLVNHSTVHSFHRSFVRNSFLHYTVSHSHVGINLQKLSRSSDTSTYTVSNEDSSAWCVGSDKVGAPRSNSDYNCIGQLKDRR